MENHIREHTGERPIFIQHPVHPVHPVQASPYAYSRQKRSGIWNYFFPCQNDAKNAECNLCKKKLSLGSQNPRKQTLTNLKRHIETLHPDEWGKLSEILKLNSSKRNTASNITTTSASLVESASTSAGAASVSATDPLLLS